MLAWIILVIAAILEPVWATALKYSHGFKFFWPSMIGIITAAVSFSLLTIALKSLPIGTAYAVWVGIGAAGVVIAGIVIFGEDISLIRSVFLIMIIIGVVGLQIIEGV